MILSSKKRFIAIAIISLSSVSVSARPKILALHGGGGNAREFGQQPGMLDLEAALPDFDFVYADGGFPIEQQNYLWIPDPPSKDNPTTTPAIADSSLENLNRIVDEEGPFYGILGFSQGAAFVPVYLASALPGTFQKAMIFSGYPTETHLGLMDLVDGQSPFDDISTLIWIGEQDRVIPPSLSQKLIPKFTSPTVISSPEGGHSCVDDEKFRHKNKSKKSCVWISSKKKRVKKFCKKKKIKRACPLTCSMCKPQDNDKPNDKPIEKINAKPYEKPTIKPNDKPYEKPGEKPNDKPVDKPDKPNDKPNDKPVDKPDKLNDKPIDKPVDKPDKPNDKPNEKPVDKPDKPNEKPVDKPDKPNDKPVDKPDKPNDKPDEEECADDKTFIFKNKKSVCAWVRKRSSKRFCKYKKIQMRCPATCNLCGNTLGL
ncbi:unnamed protein product [Pseudo-nitzschia multistriata]|uniref:ShKT domain-containing protein n=1 Tax=Pseudo-nitzschia multistriata TaxID=183589 RepID=A0A448ZNG7_9STRA|nr:unnamed protein product [Pseudo-nitzschia multistriata]